MSDIPELAADGAQVPSQSQPAMPPPEISGSGGGALLTVIERLATNPSVNVDVIERLLAQRRAEEDRAAKRAFNAAMSLAKGEIEPILKRRDVDFPSKDPAKGRTRYKFEEFADIARAIDPILAKHGLSYRFSVEQNGVRVKVACILAHADGYSEWMPPLEGSSEIPPGSNMNALQALGSALTYLQRYSLRSALGLAAGRDDDARSLSAASPPIEAAQIHELADLIKATGSNETTLLKLLGVESVADMTVNQYANAKAVLGLRLAERRKGNAPAGIA